MKKYRLKINLFDEGTQLYKGNVFRKEMSCYVDDVPNPKKYYSVEFIERNPDIFEEVKGEPQEEVIEGYIHYHPAGDIYEFVKEQDNTYNTPATLILNPKPSKKQEQYTFNVHNETVRKFRQSYYFSKPGEYSDFVNCTLIRNEKADNHHTNIKIIVEEE